MVVLFTDKEIVKTLKVIFSKTAHRNFKIFSGTFFLVNNYHFMKKKNFWFTYQRTFSACLSNSIHLLVRYNLVFLSCLVLSMSCCDDFGFNFKSKFSSFAGIRGLNLIQTYGHQYLTEFACGRQDRTS